MIFAPAPAFRAQVAPPRKRAQVRDGHVGVALRHLPAPDEEQLHLGVLLRLRHALPVHMGRGDGLGPATLVRPSVRSCVRPFSLQDQQASPALPAVLVLLWQ